MSNEAARARTVSFVSLGCAKNLVDSEAMIASLGLAGWRPIQDPTEADAVVVNTCAFIDAAKAESTEAILEQAQRLGPDQRLVVAGCLSQRYGDQLRELIPEIDGIVGTGAYRQIAEVLEESFADRRPTRLGFDAEPEVGFVPRLVTTPRATAYLKISEGCDHPCTFCIIPQLRGGFRSRSEASILAEARALVAGGARELILIGQDTSMWGRDRGIRRGGLATLLERLSEIEDLVWIRMLYLYPATVDSELIEAMARLPKVCSYLDMPLQHAHPEMLRAMRRPSNGERYHEILADFRRRVPGITLRSTFIVGFPGETEEHVAYLEQWLTEAELDRVGFFTYSAEEGTPAAELPGRIPSREQRRRLIRLREAARLASARARTKRLGERWSVLVEGRRRLAVHDPLRRLFGGATEISVGRSAGEAPGVDGDILFAEQAPIGSFVDVTFRAAQAFDFVADLAPVAIAA